MLLAFNPHLICTVNWADSGPGFSWPESYHVTYLPGFDAYVVTASRDGPDGWGCADHAIGVANGSLDPVDAAKEVVTEFWRMQLNSWEQPRWAYLFDEGLIDAKTSDAWAEEVWCEPTEEVGWKKTSKGPDDPIGRDHMASSHFIGQMFTTSRSNRGAARPLKFSATSRNQGPSCGDVALLWPTARAL